MIYRLKLVRCGFSLLDEIIFAVKISAVQWRHEQAANSIVSSNSYNSSTWITFVPVRMRCTYLNFLLQPDGGCTEGMRRWRADWTQSTACCPWSPSSRVLLLTTYCFPVYYHQFIPSPRPHQQQQQPACIGWANKHERLNMLATQQRAQCPVSARKTRKARRRRAQSYRQRYIIANNRAKHELS